MQIIGITGTLGAGKGTVASYLVSKGFSHYSVRQFLLEEMRRQGVAANLENMATVANELRALHGPSHIIEQLYEQARNSGKDCVIESIRAMGEVQALRDKEGFFLLGVDADITVRYQRISARQSELDGVTFEHFKRQEARQMDSDDPAKQNLAGCIRAADVVILNNGSIPELHRKVDILLEKLTGA